MKKVFPFFLIALVAGAILAGCSGSSESAAPAEGDKAATAGADASTDKPADGEAESK